MFKVIEIKDKEESRENIIIKEEKNPIEQEIISEKEGNKKPQNSSKKNRKPRKN